MAGGVAAGDDRPRVRVLLHRALARDPGDPAAGDRRGRFAGAATADLALHRGDPRAGRHPVLGELLAPLCHLARGRSPRGTHARAALRGLPRVPASVLRPPRDRPGGLARDQRPLSRAVLHRLGHGAGRAERHDDRRRRPSAGVREPAPGALRHRHHTADRHPRLALRPPRDAHLARGAGAQGRPDRGCRRVGGGHRDGAGVRPRGRRARPVWREGRVHPRGRHPPGRRRGPAPPRPLLPARPLDRRGAAARRHRRDQRQPHHRPVRALQLGAAAARLAARVARLDPQPRPARGGVGRPHVRVARAGAAAARAGRSPAASGRPARCALRRRALWLRAHQRGAHGREPGGRRGRAGGSLRGHRGREVDASLAALAVL